MALILTIAMSAVLLTAFIIAVYWRNVECVGEIPTSFLTFMAILFTSGLDVGLIMFPIPDFNIYANEASYAFTNPLALEFGFWGFLVWGFYFTTIFYFCIVEPKLKLFEIPQIKWTYNIVIIGTCAFSAYLFLVYLPDYIAAISDPLKYGLVGTVVLIAAASSTHIRYVKILSIGSTWLFFGLIFGMWWSGDMGFEGLANSMMNIGDYFYKINHYLAPITDYHQFYLYWWFAWSIMIGQFISRFVSGLKAWQLLAALLVVPSIPIAIWFSVLYFYFDNGMDIASIWRIAMVGVGVIFVINSLDSLMRLYTRNIGMTVERLGRLKYVASNWLIMVSLVLLYQFTPLQIEWVGLAVIAIYAVCYYLVAQRRHLLNES